MNADWGPGEGLEAVGVEVLVVDEHGISHVVFAAGPSDEAMVAAVEEEARRWLKRYIARETYRAILLDAVASVPSEFEARLAVPREAGDRGGYEAALREMIRECLRESGATSS